MDCIGDPTTFRFLRPSGRWPMQLRYPALAVTLVGLLLPSLAISGERDRGPGMMGNLGFTPDTVHAVQVTMVARKDDAEARQLRTKLKSGTTTADGATQGMATSYLPYGDLYETDPDTAMAWTPSGVNAMQVGIEVVS